MDNTVLYKEDTSFVDILENGDRKTLCAFRAAILDEQRRRGNSPIALVRNPSFNPKKVLFSIKVDAFLILFDIGFIIFDIINGLYRIIPLFVLSIILLLVNIRLNLREAPVKAVLYGESNLISDLIRASEMMKTAAEDPEKDNNLLLLMLDSDEMLVSKKEALDIKLGFMSRPAP